MISQGYMMHFGWLEYEMHAPVSERGYVCDFLFLIINIYVFCALLEETKTEMRSVLSSSPCLYLCRTWHAAS